MIDKNVAWNDSDYFAPLIVAIKYTISKTKIFFWNHAIAVMKVENLINRKEFHLTDIFFYLFRHVCSRFSLYIQLYNHALDSTSISLRSMEYIWINFALSLH